MKKAYLNYLVIPLFLLIVGIILSSCGGGEDGYVNPGLQGEPSDQLISKEVSGYIYYTGSPASSETGEITEKFVILSSPARGDDSFLSQLWGYFEETSPDSLNTQEMQNLHSRFSVEMANYVPLPEWNSSAKLYTIYQDSKSSAPISVDGSGYFSSTVFVSSKDDNVSFEVILGEDACYPVEAIASSDIASSSEGGTELKSCPEMILTLPGWCEIFAVYGNPSVNLKDAGLTFTLNDQSMGWVTEPFYVKCNGVRNYNVAYGIYISAGNLTTPVSTTITAQTATGLTLNIFTEVVKSCGSISGHVGGAGVVPFCGFVYSLGFDAFSCIDEAGNYQLNKVFKGHFRKVVAVYWVQVNGQLVRHREERTIDFFNGDLTGFDLPEGVQPTPTPHSIEDNYYHERMMIVFGYLEIWKKEIGRESATQKVINWLNSELPDGPPIPDGVKESHMCEYEEVTITVVFEDGVRMCIDPRDPQEKTIFSSSLEPQQNSAVIESYASPTPLYIKNVCVLSPFEWELDCRPSVVHDFANEFKATSGSTDNITVLSTDFDEIRFQFEKPQYPFNNTNLPPYFFAEFKDKDNGIRATDADIVGAEDIISVLTEAKYDLIYILTHGSGTTFHVSCIIEHSNKTKNWYDNHKTDAGVCFEYSLVNFPSYYKDYPFSDPNGVVATVGISDMYLANNVNLNFSDSSVLYLCACFSNNHADFFINNGVKVFLGHDIETQALWEVPVSCYLFHYMLKGFDGAPDMPLNPNAPPIPVPTPGIASDPTWDPTKLGINTPMNVEMALKTLEYYHLSPSYNYLNPYPATIKPKYKGSFPSIYFGGSANITVYDE